jgi:lipopolysaccharide export system protein LptA
MSQPVAKTHASVVARHVRSALLPALVAAAVLPTAVWARSTDRNQPMDIKANRHEGTLDGNSVNVLSGGVTITQGTLDIQAARADIYQRGGEAVRAVLTGSQAMLKQQMDDGTWMTAKADRIDYDMSTDVVVLTGNYTVTTARGSTSGQKMTYDLKTGRVESGGEGNGTITLRILPKTAQPKPATQGKP